MKTIRIGMLGCGHVGAAVARLLNQNRELITERSGVDLSITRVAIRDSKSKRDAPLAEEVFTTDAEALVRDPEIDVVVEVMGGVHPTLELLLEALHSGKPVVTANKELLAQYGEELFAAADEAGVDFLFEASVAGGIPVMRPLRESLAGERVTRVMGIVNGTTNYILSRMTQQGDSLETALAEAQRLGYAESDPTADVEGFDAASKATIIAMVTFGAVVGTDQVYREGISSITERDISVASELGYVVKLLAISEETPDGISVRVHPTFVPATHPLASVNGVNNALFIEGEALGQLMLMGPGAGGGPTASAVLGDLVDASKNLVNGSRGASLGTRLNKSLIPMDACESRFCIRLAAMDRPGVLAQVAGVFGNHAVSIETMHQYGLGNSAELVLITHNAQEGAVHATVSELNKLQAVSSVDSVFRVIGVN